MSAQLGPGRTVFGPAEIVQLATAYDGALSTITEGDERCAGLTARELRRQLASVIMAEAKGGQLDPECLKDAALRSLEWPYADREQLA